jgi:ligand-binding sensor domain-containing protein
MRNFGAWTTPNTNLNNVEVKSVYTNSGAIWSGTFGSGLYKNTNDPAIDFTTVFNMSNSGLPSDYVTIVKKDKNNHMWIGTWGSGLAKFDGTSWVVYNTQNSGIPHDAITSIHIDNTNNKVIVGTFNAGFAIFDGTNWQSYSTDNYPMPSDKVNNVFQDGQGVIWVSTNNGLVRFDGSNWNIYNEQTTFYLFNKVNVAAADEDGNIWFGTNRGLGKIDTNQNLTFIRTDNSGLPRNFIYDIKVDKHNNIWIGTLSGGLAVYNENSLVLDVDDVAFEQEELELHIYPNPTSLQHIHINGKIDEKKFSTLRVYDQSGRVIIEIDPEIQNQNQIDIGVDISELSKGMYIVELSGQEAVVREKLMVI